VNNAKLWQLGPFPVQKTCSSATW